MLSCFRRSPPSPVCQQGALDPSDSHIVPEGQDLCIFKPWDHLPPPILAHAWRPGRSCSNATSHALCSALQLCSNLPPCSHQGEVPAPHRHVTPLTIRSSPPGYRLSLCPSPAPQCKGQLSLAWQGAFLLSCTVYYSKRGIWLGEETRGQLACREAGLAE